MAALAAMASASIVAAPATATKLSSSVAFGSSQVEFTTLRNVHAKGGRVLEEGSPVRQVVSSMLAAGLVITIARSAFAASGPGGTGAERTARKANELLQGTDELIKNDSPQHFGLEQGFGNGMAVDDIDRFSQKAGSGAIRELQDAQVLGARDKFTSNVKKASVNE